MPPDGEFLKEYYAHEQAYENIVKWEGVDSYAYEDTSKVPTVGIGFNLKDKTTRGYITEYYSEELQDQGVSKAEADSQAQSLIRTLKREARARGSSSNPPLPGSTSLSNELNERVFRSLISDKLNWVNKNYAKANLNYSQKAIIADLYFQGGNKYVGRDTSFYKAAHAGDWDEVIYQVQEGSNRHKVPGIQNRHDDRVEALDIARGGDGTFRASPRPRRIRPNPPVSKRP